MQIARHNGVLKGNDASLLPAEPYWRLAQLKLLVLLHALNLQMALVLFLL